MRQSVYDKGKGSQERVLDAAIVTLAKYGIAQTSVQDIADAARMSKGAVHYHFESKDELYERVLARCCETLAARIHRVLEEPGLPMDRVRRALVEMWIVRRDGVPEIRVLNELFVVARQNEGMRRALAAALRDVRRQIVDVGFQRLVELGLRPKMSLDVAARLLLATLDGLAMHHDIEPIGAPEEAEILKAIEATMMAVFEI